MILWALLLAGCNFSQKEGSIIVLALLEKDNRTRVSVSGDLDGFTVSPYGETGIDLFDDNGNLMLRAVVDSSEEEVVLLYKNRDRQFQLSVQNGA